MVTLNEANQIIAEEGSSGVFGKIDDIFKSINVGMSRTFGLPRAITDVSSKFRDTQFEAFGIEPRETPNFLPTGEQIQELGSKVGITHPVGQEPDTFLARTAENIGAAAPILPFFGLTAPILATEAVAAPAAAAGGKFLESTEWGRKNPELARGIGEIGGGMTGIFSIPIAKFLAKGGSIGVVYRWLKTLIPVPDKRALTRIKNIEFTPQKALSELERMEGIKEGRRLLPGQAAATTKGEGIARLTKTVEEDVPKVGAFIERQRIRVVNQLQKQFTKSGDVGDARLLLEEKLALKADQATKALSKMGKVGNEAALSTRAEKILSTAKTEGNKVIDDLWENLADDITGNVPHAKQVMINEYKNIAERGIIDQIDIKQIPFTARAKLGTLNKKGKLSGGSLFKKPKTEKIESRLLDVHGRPVQQAEEIIEDVEPSAKAIHRLYSLLGSEVEKLGRFGGQRNKIRIINKLREALLKDLDSIGVGGDYKKTINLTKTFHDKFTKGTVGRILGRARGETPSPVTALEDIVGQGGVEAKENIQQALRASPKMKAQIQEFLKVKFAEVAVNDETNRINANAGNAFLKKFGKILDDLFPELKTDIKTAIARQTDVDEFIGVPTVSRLSPLQKETTAAGFFLGRNPGEEMAALLKKTTNRTSFIKELVETTRADPTGKAFRGLQNAFTEELLKTGDVDDIAKLSGTKIINKLSGLKDSILKSGLFSKDEYAKLQRIGEVFKKIEIEKGAKRFPEGIINDPTSKAISFPLRWIAARMGGKLGADIGSRLVIAGAMTRESQAWLKQFTNDEAGQLLIRFVLDKKLAKDMLTNVSKLSKSQRGSLFARILAKAKEATSKTIQSVRGQIPHPPITAIAPAAGSFGAEISDSEGLDREVQEFEQLKTLLR